MHVLDGLGISGRAGRVHPEGDLVGECCCGEGLRGSFAQQVLQEVRPAQSCPLVRARSRHDDLAQVREPRAHRQYGRGKRGCHNGCGSAAVRQQISVLLGGEQRIHGDRDVARAKGAPERNRMIDTVVQNKNNAILLAQAQGSQHCGYSKSALPQLGISDGASAIGERDLIGETALDIGVHEIGDGVVWPPLQERFERRRHGMGLLPEHPGSLPDFCGKLRHQHPLPWLCLDACLL
jgi:hypothetical protein